jgi:hypothetical protein
MKAKLSVVIVSWNVCDLLLACLDSIYAAYPQQDIEIIIVDNASSDGTVEAVQNQFPQVHLQVNTSNVGFAAANNQGIRSSQGEQILLLNPDTVIKPEALHILSRFLDEQPEAGGCGPYMINSDGTMQYSCSPEPTLWREFSRLMHLPGIRPDGYYEMSTWDTHAPQKVDTILGACLLIRRSILNSIGLMDESYFIYSEEVDLCRRIRQIGADIYWVPRARVVHHGGQSTRQVSDQMFLQLYKAKIQYFRKHHSPHEAWLYKLLLILISVPRIIVAPIAMLLGETRRSQTVRQASNYWRLLSTVNKL